MNDQAIAAAEWNKAVSLIRGAEEVALACHVNPDGDALGSMLALALALRASGRRCVASFGDSPMVVPRLLRFLPGQEVLAAPERYPESPEVMVTFDAASMERLGRLTPAAGRAGELIVVDHHASNTRFGSIHLVDPAAAATAVLVERLIAALGLPLSRDMATCLYTGLVTDTGSFKYASTTPSVHALASRLLEAGVRPEEIGTRIWDSSSFGYLQVLAGALGRATLEGRPGGGLVWTYVTRADRAAHDLAYDEVEAVIDVIRRAGEAEVAVVLKEDDHGDWQVSTRSRGAVDVGRICSAMGGGGHAKAAGFTTRLSVDETMARLRELF